MCIGPSSGAIGPVARGGHAGGVTNRPLLPAFVVLWSSGYVVGAIAIDVADPLPLLAARFLLASLLAVPLALRHGRWRGAPLGRLAVVGVLLQVVQFGGVYGGFALGVPAALAALAMLGLAPLVTSAIAVGTGHERGDARLWTGLAIGVVGVAISLAPELGDARVGVGIGVTLLGMLGLAGGTVVQKHWAGGADVRVSAAVQSVTGAVLVTPPSPCSAAASTSARGCCSRSGGWRGGWASSRCCSSSTSSGRTPRAPSAPCSSSSRP